MKSVVYSCSTPRTAEKGGVCHYPRTVAELRDCAGRFGTLRSYEVTTGAALNDSLRSCPGFGAWNAGDTVLIVMYADTTTFWRVTNVQPDYGTWVQGADPREEGLSKSEVVAMYALPNCAGTGSAWWTNCSIPKDCNCPCAGRMPADSVIRYVEKVVLPPSTRMKFGVAGANTWGRGGGLQWHLDTSAHSFIVQVDTW